MRNVGYNGKTLVTNAQQIPGKTKRHGHFEAHGRNWYVLFGLAKIGGDANGMKLAGDAAGPGQAVVNFKMEDGWSVGDALLSGLVGLVGSSSVWVEGDVVD